MRPFSEFPSDGIRHHFFPGMYAKEVRIPEGYVLVSHKHLFDHLSILASGSIMLGVDGKRTLHKGPAALNIVAGQNHEVHALTDVVWFCIHATDETDVDKVDEILIVKDAD